MLAGTGKVSQQRGKFAINKTEFSRFLAYFIMFVKGPTKALKFHFAGLAEILTAGLGLLMVGIFSIIILAVLGAFGNLAAIWPAANVTKITTNIGNAVVTGAAFLSILILLIEVGLVFVVLGLVAGAAKSI